MSTIVTVVSRGAQGAIVSAVVGRVHFLVQVPLVLGAPWQIVMVRLAERGLMDCTCLLDGSGEDTPEWLYEVWSAAQSA
jgi:hypothetical protein